jgi:hypothetical protein
MKISTQLASEYIKKTFTDKDRVLLINPPVVESRYQWVKWNQPLDLLKLSSYLKTNVGCEVLLFDFMLPKAGKVGRSKCSSDHEIEVCGHRYPLWWYGKSETDFSNYLDAFSYSTRPTQVLITSLTSYWWKGISYIVPLIKSKIDDVPIAVYGPYASLETEHASENSHANVVLTGAIDLTKCPADFAPYGRQKPEFCGLDLRDDNWPQEVIDKAQLGVTDFVFFNDDILQDAPHALLPKLRILNKRTSSGKRRIRFHALCGLQPSSFTEEAAKEMKELFVSLNFEYEVGDDKELNVEAYQKAKAAYEAVNFNLDADQLTGFVLIGLPSDNLERIIRHTLNLFQIFGSVILKPYTPSPGKEYDDYRKHLETGEIERLSPHFFPFASAQINDLTHQEYDELYTLAASLNCKVRSKAFDLFPGTLAFEMIKTSLSREVWNLE